MESIKYRIENSYVDFYRKDSLMRLQPISEEIIRCVYTKKEQITDDSLLIEKKSQGADFVIEEDEEWIYVKTKKICAGIEKISGQIAWKRANGSLWLREKKNLLSETDVVRYTTGDEAPIIKRVKTVDGERNFIQNLKPVTERKAYSGKIYFSFKEKEDIHGFGQAEEGIYNYRHHSQYLYQHNMRIPMPIFVSTEGYGILFDCCSLMTFHDEENESYVSLDTVDQLDYYFLGGESMDGIIHDYRWLTGKAAMLPKWAFGYIQSKEQYYSDQELVDVAKKYRELSVPLDCVVQDWNTWEPGNWGEKILDEKRYGHVEECIDEIHKMHVHTMVSVWPNMNAGGKNHEEFFKSGHLLYDYSTYDAFCPMAREMYWKQAKEGLFDKGFDSWWCDSTEPFSGPDWGGEIKREPLERFLLVGNEHKKYLGADKANAYALMHAKGIYENQRKTTQEKRVLNLTRSGYASSQRYGTMLWSGDISARWDVMREQITEGLNMAMSGIPYWTLDIGGFFTVKDKWQNRGCGSNTNPNPLWFWNGDFNEGVKDKGYCELYTRWLEMGCFLPMFRSHGTDTPREIWNFGEPGTMFYDAIEKYIHLRYHLMPYIYSMAGAVHFEDATMMRSLLFDFMEDERARAIDSEFMFGKSFLVCPVTEPMYYGSESTELNEEKQWSCYLPEGADWYDYWTNKKYQGGQEITVDAPLDRMPLFVKAGSIIPTVEGLQYAQQKPGEPMKLMIYPGADASFILYEDEGNNYNFEKGAYATTSFFWDDRRQELKAEPRQGSFAGMEKLTYTVEVVEPSGYSKR